MTDFERDGVYKLIHDDTRAMMKVINESPEETEEDLLKRHIPVRKAKRVFAECNVPPEEKSKATLGLCLRSVLGFFSPMFLVFQGMFR